MAIPLPQFLAEFRPIRLPADSAGTAHEPVRLPAVLAPEAPGQQAADAFARGQQAGLETAREEWEANLAAERARAELALADARSQWAAEEGERLEQLLADKLASLEASLADSVAAVLRPFVCAELRGRAVASLSESVRALLSNSPNAALSISGPADLLDALRSKLGGVTAAVDYHPSDAVDVRITAGRTVIESQMQAWMTRLELSTPELRHGE